MYHEFHSTMKSFRVSANFPKETTYFRLCNKKILNFFVPRRKLLYSGQRLTPSKLNHSGQSCHSCCNACEMLDNSKHLQDVVLTHTNSSVIFVLHPCAESSGTDVADTFVLYPDTLRSSMLKRCRWLEQPHCVQRIGLHPVPFDNAWRCPECEKMLELTCQEVSHVFAARILLAQIGLVNCLQCAHQNCMKQVTLTVQMQNDQMLLPGSWVVLLKLLNSVTMLTLV